MLISAGSGPTPEFSPASCCAPWKMEPAPPAPAAISQTLNISPNGIVVKKLVKNAVLQSLTAKGTQDVVKEATVRPF
ncbi:hypothetical protein RR46_05215 [Papilio xuthus]|uniref:Uncharacterized protein n=1 Tax=Papilio xuthus TaxID=66420 RepID=A0A194QEW1_PAPXU|nr:hypothetical protein RR46_05215 [Papilio xuthus]